MTLGTDPEFFVKKDNKIVPFLDFIGDEEEVLIDGFVKIHRDNVMLEMNTIPENTREGFIQVQQESIRLVNEFIQKEFGLSLAEEASWNFEDVQDFRIFDIGCMPSLNLYEEYDIAFYENYERFCGGHLHIGYDGETEELSKSIISNMDHYVGLHLDEKPSNRRMVYGRAGEYRRDEGIKVEYRTPSNEWLVHSKFEWMWNQTQKALEDALKGVTHTVNPELINKPKVLC